MPALAQPDEVVETELTIVGAGVAGVLAAKECIKRNMPFFVVDRNQEIGGVWNTLSNNHSSLQVRGAASLLGPPPCRCR